MGKIPWNSEGIGGKASVVACESQKDVAAENRMNASSWGGQKTKTARPEVLIVGVDSRRKRGKVRPVRAGQSPAD
jgi:hypothetical protein